MQHDGAKEPRASWRASPFIQRLTGGAARLSATVFLAAGAASEIAARRRSRHDDADNERSRANGERGARDGEPRRDREARREDRKDDRAQDRDRNQNEEDSSENMDRDGRRNRDRNEERDRSRKNDEDDNADSVTQEQNNNNKNNNKDDEPNNEDDDEDGNERGNAGSGFFDSSLATKARRRAKDFDNRDRDDEEDDGIIVDVDPEGESTYQTDTVFFATGPDGIEVITRNINYTAAPTPTPTPFPTLQLPERERLDVFANLRSPTPAPTAPPSNNAPAPEPTRAPRPTEPAAQPTPGTDGGDNNPDLVS